MAIETAVIIAGAVARGAYEAGALAKVLSQKLAPEDLPHTLFLGTSAGAINAMLWAGFANGERSVADIGEAVCEVWRGLHDTEVFAPLKSAALATAKGISGKGRHFLDTRPLAETVRKKLAELTLTDNVHAGHVGGVALAATFCGETAAGARSDVFYQSRATPRDPKPYTALRYVRTEIEAAHVLASSAVPALFAPVAVGDAYYVDGGVRLNTPMAPAIDFGAKRIIVVSSHATYYPKSTPIAHAPAPDDALALAIHSLLADKAIEDLARLRRINKLILDHPQARLPYELIKHIVVSPHPGRLAELTRQALAETYRWRVSLASPRNAYRALRYCTIENVVKRLGSGKGADELLSYVLFDPAYFEAQIQQGENDAADALASDWQVDPGSDQLVVPGNIMPPQPSA